MIYLDEAQDSNDLTLDIVLGAAKKGCQVILVGDTYQSIYAWRGAVNAFDKIPADYVRLSLTTSFRFHNGIASNANKMLKQLGCQEEVYGAAKESNYLRDSAFICRTNKGVFKTILALASEGKKSYCTFDFSSFFNSIFHAWNLKVNGDPAKRFYTPFKEYETWEEFILAADLNDEVASVIEFLDSTDNIFDKIKLAKESIIKEPEFGVPTVSTMHKSKGMEWDEVTIVNDFAYEREGETYEEMLGRVKESLIPSQLGNLLYVGMTRAKQKLNIDSTLVDILGG